MSIAIAKPRLIIALMAMAAVLVGSLWTSTARSEAASVNCGTFTVLHNDRIGNLRLPKGKYTVRVSDGAPLTFTCAKATQNFRNFLWDYDGVLPRPWTYRARGVGNGKFFQRTNRQVAFTVVKQGSPAPTPGPTPGPGRFTRCPGTFRVLNNDRISNLRLPKGPYFVYVASSGSPTCASAENRFRNFLSLGQPRAPWRLNAKSAVFSNPNTGAAFRVKQAS